MYYRLCTGLTWDKDGDILAIGNEKTSKIDENQQDLNSELSDFHDFLLLLNSIAYFLCNF